MPNHKKLRDELIRKKRFIAERSIDLVSKDPLMLELAQNDPHFADMFRSFLRIFPPEARLWAEDVVISE